MVFYRKYRPQTLDEIIGQTVAKQTLKSVFAAGKLAHAYLFCGPKGTGKTSTARILAKMVNCENQPSAISHQPSDKEETSLKTDSEAILTTDSLPCNQCPACISITNGSNLDVIEMDAASNRGIEDIRSLRENIKLAPTAAPKKVYIIDEVHMLSGDAFNALLKTLEEPPSHVLFILATTELQKIPATILSRVQKLEFKLASTQELIEDLKRIVAAEGLEAEEEALVSLAQRAGGSFRDAEKFLDQLSSIGPITQQSVEERLGMGNFDNLVKIGEQIARGENRSALENLANQLQSGISVRELNLFLLDLLRQVLLIKNGAGEAVVKEEIGADQFRVVEKLADQFTLEKVMRALESFQKSLEQARFVSIPSLPLEMAVVESCMGEKPSAISCQSSENSEAVRKADQKTQKDSDSQSVRNSDKSDKPELRNSDTSDTQDVRVIPSPSGDDVTKLQDRWTYVLETVRQDNFSLEALLRSAKIIGCDEKEVAIEVPYSFHKRILEAPKSKDLVESIFADILGRSIKVTTVLGQRPVNREELANVEVAADDEIIRIASEIFNSEPIS